MDGDDYDGDDSQDTAQADDGDDTAAHIMRGGYLRGQR